MKIAWVSNAHLQATGYGRICKHVVQHIHQYSEHEMVEFAISGLNHCEPFDWNGVRVYSPTSRGGKFGLADWPVVQGLEQPDLWMLNFDAWSGGQPVADSGLKYVLYPPVDHDPLSPLWDPIMRGAVDIVPYCKFGERVMRDALGMTYPISEPIYHGIDQRVLKPLDITKEEVFSQPVAEEDFVVGIFKNNQGTRAKYEINLRAFALFLQRTGDEKARLYLHCEKTGPGAFDLPELIHRFGLAGKVFMIGANDIRYGVSHAEMAKFYNGCDVILNTNAGEGFGFPVIEAFACGKPVIATAYSSMPELLGVDEGRRMKLHPSTTPEVLETSRGWLVPMSGAEWTLGKLSTRFVFNELDVAAALVEAWKDRERCVAKGKEAHDWVQQFSWDVIGDQWIAYFNAIEKRLATKQVTWPKPVVEAPEPPEGGYGDEIEGVVVNSRETRMGQNAIAAAVFSFNRAEYLTKTLSSLVENTAADKVDWFLRQDGWKNGPLAYTTEDGEKANKELVQKCTTVLEYAPFNAATMKINEVNVCMARQVRDAMRDIFETELCVRPGYEAAIFFDDDHVVSEDYIELLLKMHEQFPDAIVGAQATEERHIPKDGALNEVGVTLKQTPDTHVRPGRWRWLGYLVPRSVYLQIASALDEYIEDVGPSQWNIPHLAICVKYGIQVSGYDGFLDKLCEDLGIERVATVIPRGRYIGKVGRFGSEQLYRRMGFRDTLKYAFDEDPVDEFVIRGEQCVGSIENDAPSVQDGESGVIPAPRSKTGQRRGSFFGFELLSDCDGIFQGYQPWIVEQMKRYVKPGQFVLDVGAGIGLYSVLMGSLVGPEGEVHSFEPSPRVHDILATNTSALPAVQIHEEAVGVGRIVPVWLYQNPDNTGDNRLYKFPNALPETVQVDVTSIDDMFCDQASVDFVKIDAQGSDFDVLRGMERLLERSEQVAIIVEYSALFWTEYGEEDPESVVQWLEDRGFEFREMRAGVHGKKPCCAHLPGFGEHTDLLFVKERNDG